MSHQKSERRLNENDKPLAYASDHEVKRISSNGFLWHEGHACHVGEIFAGKRVGLRRNSEGLIPTPAEACIPGARLLLA